MKSRSVDQYILASNDFAKPVLEHLRSIIHLALPQIRETIKWGIPYFELEGNLCYMAAFKEHVIFGFWNAGAMIDSDNIFVSDPKASMGQLGKLKSINDLPPQNILIKYLNSAKDLNMNKVKTIRNKHPKVEIVLPEDFESQLIKQEKAFNNFNQLSSASKREYIQWITDAKTQTTRDKRIDTAVEWISEGKTKNWKYQSS